MKMNSQTVFQSIQSHLDKLSSEEKKVLLSKLNAIFQFDLKQDANQETQSTVLDLKNHAEGGKVMSFKQATAHSIKPDIVVQTTEATFIDLATGKLQGQKAFMAGQLKVKGNMMLATRLDTLFKSVPLKSNLNTSSTQPNETNSSSNKKSGTSTLASMSVFKQLQASLATMNSNERDALIKNTKAVFLFHIKDSTNQIHPFTLDLKKEGKLTFAEVSPVDVTLILADHDFVDLVQGKLNGQKAFASGKLKVKGQMMLAMKLDATFKAIQKKSKL